MTHISRKRTHRPALILLLSLVTASAILGVLLWPSASSLAPSFGAHSGITGEEAGAATEADGVLPDGVTVFEDEYAALANLDPTLLQAIRATATDAAHDGITFYVNSGWRSPAYQNQLLEEAIAEYDSAEEAARWVATADTSPHVSGNAIDIGDWDAWSWLSDHGADYNLCQIYLNEPWHYELRPTTDRGCPRPYPDPTYDPRMQE